MGVVAKSVFACVALIACVFLFLKWRDRRRHEREIEKADPDIRAFLIWRQLPDRKKTPEAAEAYLKKHPNDLSRRIGLLGVYNHGESRDFSRLRHHTLELIKRCPQSSEILWANYSEFFRHPEFKKEVLNRLEEVETAGDVEVYGNLSNLNEHGAFPVPENEREKFLQWHMLDPDTQLPEKLDNQAVEKAIHYRRKAIEASDSSESGQSWQWAQLGKLFNKANRMNEAISALEHAVSLESDSSSASTLVELGVSLYKARRLDEAFEKLREVRRHDSEGFEGGPGCYTMNAENLLGFLALEQKNLEEAKSRLIASLDVEPCCHTTTRGVNISLAEKLIDMGQGETVVEFCDEALKRFIPDDETIIELRSRASRPTINQQVD